MLYNVTIKNLNIIKNDYQCVNVILIRTLDSGAVSRSIVQIYKYLSFENLVSYIQDMMLNIDYISDEATILYNVFKFIEDVITSRFGNYPMPVNIDYNDYELIDSIITDIVNFAYEIKQKYGAVALVKSTRYDTCIISSEPNDL